MSSRSKKKQVRRAEQARLAGVALAGEHPAVAGADRLHRDRPLVRSLLTGGDLLIRRRRGSDLLFAAIIVLIVAAPMLFTKSGFAVDFTNHLWLTWAAGKALAQAGHPSYFFNTWEVGVFYPWFAFYGGTLYVIVGGISEVIGGHPILAYVGFTTLAVAGSYLGMVWLGREFGLRGWTSHAPALVVITSAYYITNLYGRGAWTELIATAVIAPLLASGLHLVRTPAWRPWPILVFVVSAILFTGSHNITLLWGSTVALIAAIIMWLTLGRPRHLPIRRLAMVGGLGAVSFLVNAWFLLPDIAYAQDVRAHLVAVSEAWASFFDTPQVLFNPLREVPSESTTPALYVQVPMWFLLWGLLAGVVLLLRRPRSGNGLRRTWIGVVILIGVLLGMIMLTPLWSVMPFPFDEIQFPYRLSSYVFYAVGGLVLVGALALQRSIAEGGDSRTIKGLRLGLLGACVVSIGLCVWQLWVPSTLFFERSYNNRREALASVNELPHSWYDPGSYRDIEAGVVNAPPGRMLVIDPSQVHGDRFAAWVKVPPGLAPIDTNIAGGSYLVHISGLTLVGRTPRGYAVVRREREGDGPVHVVVQTTSSAVIALGRGISMVACLTILAILAWAFTQSLRRVVDRWRGGGRRYTDDDERTELGD